MEIVLYAKRPHAVHHLYMYREENFLGVIQLFQLNVCYY